MLSRAGNQINNAKAGCWFSIQVLEFLSWGNLVYPGLATKPAKAKRAAIKAPARSPKKKQKVAKAHDDAVAGASSAEGEHSSEPNTSLEAATEEEEEEEVQPKRKKAVLKYKAPSEKVRVTCYEMHMCSKA